MAPFKGDEIALQGMEKAELINIERVHGICTCRLGLIRAGHPDRILPGRPVYHTAILKMLEDKRLTATMNMLTNKVALEVEVEKLRKYEAELQQLSTVVGQANGILGGGSITVKGEPLKTYCPEELQHRVLHLLVCLGKSSKESQRLEGQIDSDRKQIRSSPSGSSTREATFDIEAS